MKCTNLELSGLKLIELDLHGDDRGFFVERFHVNKFQELEIPNKIFQINHSRSGPNVLRGLHFQINPNQGKLIGVVRGKIWDVAVDIRKDSPTYGQSYGVELTDTNGKLLWVPAGFAHGFCTLGEGLTDVLYYVDAAYTPINEGGILWDDPDLNIHWPVKEPATSERDQNLSSWENFESPFKV